ncbi:metallophosphoesterase [Tamlana sp. 2_MG-2023]|uniref:metallophosphoesterase n=1 Tax=unclassified Tamlana TaxID=2614803 RepID=UPI0026E23B7D|nr:MULTISPECIES: metallophosphoesterase [unclassified Tamlana]MDO6759986.1 metallophosphoesterase [Tamlana sp. 2_MG-2023]MDO6791844.1 metallophosphoesterase [Tamlana sp. 1_MG-2023]
MKIKFNLYVLLVLISTITFGQNTIDIVNPPQTVNAASNVDITFNYTVDKPGGAYAYIRFKVGSSNLTANNTFVNQGSGTLTLSIEIPLGTPEGAGYSFQAQLFNHLNPGGWEELDTKNYPGITVEPEPSPGDIVIAPGDNWKYFDDGNEPAGNWKIAGFNDDSWAFGNSELGYGEGDEATMTNSGALTTYFRKSFNLTDIQEDFAYLDLTALRDDGMIVYINGTEVWRDNMPMGSVNYDTFALTAATENIWINKVINNFLIEGENVIAIEIHQNSATSSDVSFNFRLKVSPQVIAQLRRGPYLQKGNSNAITIKYRTNTNTETVINYGTSLGALNSSVSDVSLSTDHEIEITGLLPNTKYFYEIANNAGVYVPESGDMYFKTAPPVGTDQFVRAWILGDAGTGNQNQKNVRDQYYDYVSNASTNPDQTDMMLFLGDNAYDSGLDSEYQSALFNIYSSQLKKTVAWSTLGNHDGYSADSNTQSGPYYDIFTFPTAAESGGVASGTEAYYSFDYANIHFIVLESYTLDNNATQIAWCTQDMQNTDQDWIVAIFHHPPYSKGSHDSDSESQLINMRNNFLPILEENGVDLVLSGHSHSYERSYFINEHYGMSNSFDSNQNTIGTNGHLSGKADTSDGAYEKVQTQNPGAVYITTGSAGKISGGNLDHNAMFSSLNELGSCVLEIENDGGLGQNLTVKFINDNGSVSDYFTINKTGILLSIKSNAINSNDTKVYPVPVVGVLNIEVDAGESLKEVKIYNAIGELVKKTARNHINVNTIQSGMYFLQIITDKGEYFKSIIVK